MNGLAELTWRAATLGRWTARVLGSLMVLFFLAFLLAEGPPPFSRFTATERLMALGMGAVFLGLAAAWKWEGWGGLLSVAGFALMVALSRRNMHMWAVAYPAIIGAAHLLCWIRLRTGPPAGLAPWQLSRNTILILVGALAIFLLLCANEMFGAPPLMTPSLRPSADLLGTWTSTASGNVVFTIRADASVAGTIRGVPVIDGRIRYGRSWFGSLMNWNCDYVIRGFLSGNSVAAPLIIRGQGLEGSLVLANRPSRLILRKQ